MLQNQNPAKTAEIADHHSPRPSEAIMQVAEAIKEKKSDGLKFTVTMSTLAIIVGFISQGLVASWYISGTVQGMQTQILANKTEIAAQKERQDKTEAATQGLSTNIAVLSKTVDVQTATLSDIRTDLRDILRERLSLKAR